MVESSKSGYPPYSSRTSDRPGRLVMRLLLDPSRPCYGANRFAPALIVALIIMITWQSGEVTVSGASLTRADDWPFGVNHGHNFSIMAEGGLLWHRQDFTWNSIEPENGTFIFDQYDEVVRQTTDAGIRILGILDYSAEWASSAPTSWTDGRDRAPPKYLSDWDEYVYRTVDHFKGRVSHWEVWNEPNTRFFWLPKADPLGYTNLLRTAYLAAKRADPECTILIGGVIGFNFEFLEKVYSYGGGKYFDVMATHPYPGSPDPCFDQFNFSDAMKWLRAIMARHGDDGKEIWFTEIAWGLGPNFTRRDQANFLVRAYVLSFAEGVSRLLWFNFRGPPQEEGSALLEYDFTPRPAFTAHQNLARLLGDADYDAKVPIKDIQCHAFRRGEERILFIWVPYGTREVGISLKSKVENIAVTDIFGQPLPVRSASHRLRLDLSESPIILERLTPADIKALSGGSTLAIAGAIVLGMGAATSLIGYRCVATRRSGPRQTRARRTKPAECRKIFDPDLCFRCRDYAVKGSKHYCTRYRSFLEK